MAEGVEQIELKFRIFDGTDIGHGTYASSITVEALKKSLLSQWPKDKTVAAKSINDVKLIHAGRILENSETLADPNFFVPGFNHSSGPVIMHAVVQRPPVSKKQIGKNMKETPKQKSCSCNIL